jgi:PmbA protein
MSFQQDQAEALLNQALARGASAGDILVVEGDAFSAQVRLNAVEKISRAQGKRLGLRLFFGKRSALTSTSDFTETSLARLLSDTCDLAQYAQEDDFAALPDPSACAKEIPELALFDPEADRLSVDEKIEWARRTEHAALSHDPRLTNSEGGDFGHSHATVLYAATNGFRGQYQTSHASLSVSPIAVADGQMQRDYWYSSRRALKQLESPESVGRTAAIRTLRRLGARKVATQQVPVVFDPETAASLLGHLISAISGYALYKRASFLLDRLGSCIAAPCVTIDDDPTIPFGLGSRPFDGEGLPALKKRVVAGGILESYLLDTYSARKLGMTSTGNASRGTSDSPSVGATNFQMRPGSVPPEEVIRSVKSGLYITDLIGFGVNTVTGDYSRGACGIWIENGELAYPVEEITIAGNLSEMFQQVEIVANDLDATRAIAAPTLKIARMTIAGD